MNFVIHKAVSRGHANHGWLDTFHTFSFADYYNPERVNFGVLRVLNDDIVQPGKGFGVHPHNNMEIISIPISGALEHKDSMGHIEVIRKNEVQVMSAGTGITHSEYNSSNTDSVNFLQIWIIPESVNVDPRYDQMYFDPEARINKWQRVVSPKGKGKLWINQSAFLSMAVIQKGKQLSYEIIQSGNGIYVFVIEGDVSINNNILSRRDGMGIYELETEVIKAKSNAELLIIEVPVSTDS